MKQKSLSFVEDVIEIMALVVSDLSFALGEPGKDFPFGLDLLVDFDAEEHDFPAYT